MAKNSNEQDVYFQKAWSGDYSQFEKLDSDRRNKLAQDYMAEYCARYPELGREPAHSDHVVNLLKEQAMNPAFRLGCSLRSRDGAPEAGHYAEYDDYMNAYLMEQTLRPMDQSRLQSLKDQGLSGNLLDNAVGQNVEKQVILAKTLFLAHLGEAQLLGAEKLPNAPDRKKLDRPIASMMAHCSRTAYVFPPGNSAQQNKLFDSLLGPDLGKGADVYRRMAATHSVSSGPTINDFKEQKKFSMLNQYGMNIAIGGVGNPGIGGPNGPQTLKNDGSCGHMYMHVDKGGVNKCSSLLVGFESDAPGVANQQGHTHDAKATPESMSSFLGQRTDEMGEKYGGRIVDCTNIPIDKLELAVNEFTDHYRSMLIEGMGNSTARNDLNRINEKLCASPMEKTELAVMMCQIGMDKDKVVGILKSPQNPGITENRLADVHSRNSATDLKKPPQKPGRFTRLKAAFGNAEAKKACQEHKDYQAALAGRAAEGVDLGRMKGSATEGSLKHLSENKAAWKAGKTDVNLRKSVAYRDMQLEDSPKISSHRTQKSVEKLLAGASMIPPAPAEEASKVPPARNEEASMIPPARSDGASMIPPTRSDGASMIPPARSDGASMIPPARSDGASMIPPARSDGASMIPPKRNDGASMIPPKREEPSRIPFREKPAAKPAQTKGERKL